jgi:hypothetical protein
MNFNEIRDDFPLLLAAVVLAQPPKAVKVVFRWNFHLDGF